MTKSKDWKGDHKVIKSRTLKEFVSKKSGGSDKRYRDSKSGHFHRSGPKGHDHPKGRTILVPKGLRTSSSDETSDDGEEKFN